MRRPRFFIAALAVGSTALVAGSVPGAQAIIGGSTISPGALQPGGEYGWLVHLLSTEAGACTGSLIAPDWVLTAAHCVPTDAVFLGGDTTPTPIDDTVIHPEWDGVSNEVDAALVHLATPSTRTPVPMVGLSHSLPTGSPVMLAGWGVTTPAGGTPEVPAEVGSTIIQSTTSLWVTGSDGMSCFGDSGGPMLHSGSLAGVVSAGDANCAEFSLGPRLRSLRSWIDSVAGTGGGGGTNHPPVAASGELTVAKNDDIEVVIDYSDPDGDSVSVTGLDSGDTEFAACSEAGPPFTCTFTPHLDFVGDTEITYTVSDGDLTATGTWLVHVVDPPVAPVALDTDTVVRVDTPRPVFLDATDANGDPLTFTVLSGPTHGTIDDCSSGVCTYSPATGYLGPDALTFHASDGTFTSNTATLSITIAPNAAPVALDGQLSASSGAPTEVLLDGADPDGEPVTAQIVAPPAHGDLECSDVICTYTSVAGYTGSDSFAFQLTDGEAFSNVATVDILVVANQRPVAESFDVVVKKSTPELLVLSATDAEDDPMTAVITTPPAHGAVECTGFQCEYRPTLGYVGDDSFEWSAADAGGPSEPATVSVLVGTGSWSVRPMAQAAGAPGLVAAVAGEATVANVVFSGAAPAAGAFSGAGAAIGLDTGIVLSTGYASGAIGPNTHTAFGAHHSTAGTAALDATAGFDTFDAAVLEFDLTPASSTVALDVVWASEEYPESPGSEYNDSAIVQVGAQRCLLPGSQQISVSGVNGGNELVDPVNPALFLDNEGGTRDTEFDGLTSVIHCTFAVTPGTPTHVLLAVGDSTDGSIDSALFIGGSFVNSAPTADAGPNLAGSEGTPIEIAGVVTDSDGDGLSLHWTLSADGPEDVGTACSIADETAVDTTLTCNDDGVYTLALTADDGFAEPAIDSITVTVGNVAPAPVVSITGVSLAGEVVLAGAEAAVAVAVTDPGGNDTIASCNIDWGDGTTAPATITGDSCTTTHVYADAGLAVISVTAVDDDGGTATDEFVVAVGTKDATVVGAIDDGDGPTAHGLAVVVTDGVAAAIIRSLEGEFVAEIVECTSGGRTATCTAGGTWNGVPGHTATIEITDGDPDHAVVSIHAPNDAVVVAFTVTAARGALFVAVPPRRGPEPPAPPRTP